MVKESEVNLQHISLWSGIREQATSYCKPKLKNKGAILILMWNFLLTIVPLYLKVYVHRPSGKTIGTVALGFTMPFAGWLADVYLGRYKVIHWSMWIMWTASMLATASSVVAQLMDKYYIFKDLSVVFFIIMAIGFGGYQANIIQFGLDQLQDASTTEIRAFISWFIWTYFCSYTILLFSHMCIKEEYLIFGQLIVCTSITIVIASSFVLDTQLVKEPVTQNPFKLIYKVIKYATKHKYPRCRSAFTYCEDELPSRIDFGKSKYGGPFTTEQVEDVKTFLRLLIIMAIVSIIISEIFITYIPRDHLTKILLNTPSIKTMYKCYKERFLTNTIGYCATALLIPLYKLIIYPTMRRYIPSIKIYQKFLLGVVIQIANIIILLLFDIIARRRVNFEHHRNVSHCIFNHDQHPLSFSFNSSWMAITQVLDSISITLIYISAIEFFVSQTPYSMRGLIFGAGYGSTFIFTMIGYGIYLPFTHPSTIWDTGIISCEIWYLLLVLLILLIFSGLLLVVGRWYKNRKREDVLPNEHIFAERFYTQP